MSTVAPQIESDTDNQPVDAELVHTADLVATAEIVRSSERRVVYLKPEKRFSLLSIPGTIFAFLWDSAGLTVLLAVTTAVPIVQLAALGYILYAASRLSSGRPWREALPGRRIAGRMSTFIGWMVLLWLPVWFVTDLSYRAQLLVPGSPQATAWRLGSFASAAAWTIWVVWAALRGGRWWHFIWPAPILFVKQIWRPSLWSGAADRLWDLAVSLRFPQLWWLGARAAAGALVWLAIPVSLMVIGLRAQQLQVAGLLGFIGAMLLTWVMMVLPQAQIVFAERNQFRALFDVREVRKRFMHAPIAVALTLVILYALCMPLYLMRIEATPQELAWLPSLVYIVMMLPAKILMGGALGYAARRPKRRMWLLRWPVFGLLIAGSLFYVGSLYIGQFIAWQGVYVMYLQHAVMVPTPLISQ